MATQERFAQVMRLFADDDQDSRPERAQRYLRLTRLMPRSRNGMLLPGGMPTLLLIEETQKLFVEGRWLSTIFTAYASLMHAAAREHGMRPGCRAIIGYVDRSVILADMDANERAEVSEAFEIFDRYWLPQPPPSPLAFCDDSLARDAERMFAIIGRYFYRHFAVPQKTD
jgi:hypothetical protein